MKMHDRLEDSDPSAPTVVTVGVFDGFHLGHARVIETLQAAAREHDACSCVVTFRAHPLKALGKTQPDLVTSLDHRLILLERAGVDAVLALDFTPEVAALSAEQFLKGVVVGKLGARALVVGYDARFGAGAEADAGRIAELGCGMGLDVRVVEPVIVLGEPVSSTRVREAVHAGDLETAAALLGRRVSVLGTVVRGDGRGKTLGFPTANVDVNRQVRPPWGVYVTRARVEGAGGAWLPSATNVGPRPTYDRPEKGARPDLLIETHLLDIPPELHGELYGRRIEVEFVKKLRDERRFGTDRELSDQIARDVDAARAFLSEEGRP
jgi:riboflavin kinase/FMN adenylyltransferase